jgi:hypothetical protein
MNGAPTWDCAAASSSVTARPSVRPSASMSPRSYALTSKDLLAPARRGISGRLIRPDTCRPRQQQRQQRSSFWVLEKMCVHVKHAAAAADTNSAAAFEHAMLSVKTCTCINKEHKAAEAGMVGLDRVNCYRRMRYVIGSGTLRPKQVLLATCNTAVCMLTSCNLQLSVWEAWCNRLKVHAGALCSSVCDCKRDTQATQHTRLNLH